jgi:hypothetical protein
MARPGNGPADVGLGKPAFDVTRRFRHGQGRLDEPRVGAYPRLGGKNRSGLGSVLELLHVLAHRLGHGGDELADDQELAFTEQVHDGVGPVAE